ncbi:hypothetical protein OIU34_20290 [Pararhizobium sp. BT-229]|uniref:hypothetical protein n=1 Tax=Pararhizobium sp. BT-229 TaxID=2986923 RepID=UPI0021F6F96B|nr:hypothetical protein [Pararhizobium sp. BT-229]MCV9964228.1 hypothetical protein [Pararhizobium sp. BT-229]
MLVKFPFMYHAEVLMGRSEKVRKETFLESFEIDIPVPGKADMPIAMSVQTNYGSPTPYRYHDGRFLTEVPQAGGISAVNLIPAGQQGHRLSERIMDSVELPIKSMQEELKAWYFTSSYEADRKPHPSQVREWISSNRESSLEKARDYASGMAILEGQVWFPVEEPKFGVSTVMMPTLTITDRPIGYAARKSSMWGHPMEAPVFNINALAEADGYCADRFQRVHVAFDRLSLDIRMPEVFTFDRARHTIDWTANEAIDLIASGVKRMPDEAVLQWLETRRVFTKGNREDADWEERVAQSVEALVPFVSSERKRQGIEAMLSVWADSAITLDLVEQRKLAR